MSGGAAVLIARAPEIPEHRRELESLLGTDRAGELASLLETEAKAWAGEVAPASVCAQGPDTAGRLGDAIARVLSDHGGPLLVIWPLLARFDREHAVAALDDLDAGAEAVVGPMIDGGLYLLGLKRPLTELLNLPDEAWRAPQAMASVLAAAGEAGLELGILRAERGLSRPADVRAALADPLTPDEVRGVLRARDRPGPG